MAVACLAGTSRAKTIHVFLIGGQSNADGRANITGSSPELSPPLATSQNDVPIYYRTSALTPTDGSYPFENGGHLGDA